ncbi:DNA-processing protein DprA [Mariprofundus erugo]|nr:DNA-processing protein DprA [Mariprofundus erugo]
MAVMVQSSGAAFSSARAARWLELALVHGVGPMLGRRLVAAFGGIEPLLAAAETGLPSVPGVGPQLSAALAHGHKDEALALLARCEAAGIGVICPDDDLWPPSFELLEDAPLLLFVKGNPSVLGGERMLAVVGARKASREGVLLTRRWSHYLASHGVSVVSGMAAGIDAAAHGGALEAEGITVAVLGCGLLALNGEQPRQVEAVARQGCVVSEFFPAQSARPEYFPRRNRIIAGLAQATLVMEADLRSGSLITARLAAEYGREVFAVPGSVLGSAHAGCHQLIRDGAVLVEQADQLLQQMGWQGADLPSRNRKMEYNPVDAQEAAVLAALAGGALHLDSMAETCGLTLPELSPILLRLELQGVVERLPGSRYLLASELCKT